MERTTLPEQSPPEGAELPVPKRPILAAIAPVVRAVPAKSPPAKSPGAASPLAKSPPFERWQRELQQAVRDPGELARRLQLPLEAVLADPATSDDFGLLVPESFLARIRPGDPHDPLLSQVLVRREETLVQPGFSADPVADRAATVAAGLLQKYAQRVLLIVSGTCAVHCRYCFRREFPYDQGPKGDAAWDPAVAQIAADRTIREVIYSGGDPLTLADSRLARLTRRIAECGHVRRLRVHTRLPVVIPARVTSALVEWLTGTQLTPIVVIHANHAQELDASVAAAIGRLRGAGVQVLNQAVLLRGVNDSVDALADLSERLLEIGVIPYYLHQLDRVQGAAHFEVEAAVGLELIAQLRARLPGYLVPRYVWEEPGAASKVPLA